jgi:hypothetical protein
MDTSSTCVHASGTFFMSFGLGWKNSRPPHGTASHFRLAALVQV